MKSVRPTTVVLTILVFGSLLAGHFWAQGIALNQPFPTDLAVTPEGKLAILYGPDMVVGNSDGQVTYSLSSMGVGEGAGGLAFNDDGGVLLGENTDGSTRLFICRPDENQCQPFARTGSYPKRSFAPVYFTNQWYIADTANHRILVFEPDGNLSATLDVGLKYPNQLLVQADSLYVANTNRHEILELIPTEKNSFRRIRHSVEPSTKPFNERWPISVAKLGDYWWILNTKNHLIKGSIHRYSQDWEFVDRIELPEGAEPVRLLAWDDNIYLTDGNTRTIMRFDQEGKELPPLGWTELERLRKEYSDNSSLYNNIAALVWVLFVAALGAGFIIAFRQVRESLPVITADNSGAVDVDDPRIQWLVPNKKFRNNTYVILSLIGLLALAAVIAGGVVIFSKEPSDQRPYVYLLMLMAIFVPVLIVFYFIFRTILGQKIGVMDDWIILSKPRLFGRRETAKGKGRAILHSPTFLCIGDLCISLGNPSLPVFPYGELIDRVYPLLKAGTELTPTQMQVKLFQGGKGLVVLSLILAVLLFIGLR